MKSLIVRSGYLKIHEHNRVAEIIFSNGNTSVPLTTKRQALEIIEAMNDLDTLGKGEFEAIREQIHASPLPNREVAIKDDPNNDILIRLAEIESLVQDVLESIGQEGSSGEDWKRGGQ